MPTPREQYLNLLTKYLTKHGGLTEEELAEILAELDELWSALSEDEKEALS